MRNNAPVPAALLRVLVCDDNERVRLTLTRALGYKAGIEIVGEVASFEDLERELPTARPDIVLLDVNMPGMSGVDGLAHLRAAGLTLPVIVMSAERRHEEPALAAGAASFFYKGSTDINALVADIRAATAPPVGGGSTTTD
jgi:DNA-binding NarL/FixJ family response regulator